MKNFVLVQDGKAHELIEAEAWPFHEAMHYLDVTGEDVQIGDVWDGETFHRPITPAVSMAAPITPAITIYKLTPEHPLAAHQHDRSHLLVVATGRVSVTMGEKQWEMEAPAVCTLDANLEHQVEAVTEQASILSIFEQDL
jgi:quercetin dioxygenase-like cupin family protein